MEVIAQSQPAAKPSYIHLAYISAQLDNRISKGELLPVQTILGVAVATAIACGAIGARLAQEGRRGRAAKIGGVLGFFGTLALLCFVQLAWSESRSNEAAVKHVIQTRQFWALREAPIAAGIEAAAATNGTAASMAADYYGLKGGTGREAPELVVRGYRYCELAAAQGQRSRWTSVSDLTNSWYAEHLKETFEAALKAGKLSEAEQTWTKMHLARIAEQIAAEDRGGVKH
jgi:hypothetical protein